MIVKFKPVYEGSNRLRQKGVGSKPVAFFTNMKTMFPGEDQNSRSVSGGAFKKIQINFGSDGTLGRIFD